MNKPIFGIAVFNDDKIKGIVKFSEELNESGLSIYLFIL